MGDLLNRPDFDLFWDTTPRKVGKGAARAKYKAAVKLVSPEALQAAVEAHAAIWNELTGYQSKKGKDRIEALKFCPHPATWLHGERWEDEEIIEYLAKAEEPEQYVINHGEPGYAEWRKFVPDLLHYGGKIVVPTPYPPGAE